MSFVATPPFVVADVDFEDLFDQRIANFLALWSAFRAAHPELDLPDYDVASLQTSPAVVALQAAAEGDVFYRGLINDVARATLLVAFATGADLDLHGLATRTPSTPDGVARNLGETDDSYRARITAARAGSSAAGPDEWWLSHVRSAHAGAMGADLTYHGLGQLTVAVVVADGSDETAVLDAVRARLALNWVRPQGITVSVVAA